jgi:hypothetical protein
MTAVADQPSPGGEALRMKRPLVRLAAAAALLAAPLILSTASQAMPEGVCRARCNRHFNPADYPKWERWGIQKKFDQCMALCRRSRE